MALREPEIFGADLPFFDTIVQRSCDVVPCDHLEGDEEIPRGWRDLVVVGDDLNAPDPHPIPVDDAQEVRADAEVAHRAEPVGRRATQSLPLLRHEGGDHLVEHADLIREEELKLLVTDLVDLFYFAFPKESHSAPDVGEERGLLGVWVDWILDLLSDFPSELRSEVPLEEMQAQIDRRRDAAGRRD